MKKNLNPCLRSKIMLLNLFEPIMYKGIATTPKSMVFSLEDIYYIEIYLVPILDFFVCCISFKIFFFFFEVEKIIFQCFINTSGPTLSMGKNIDEKTNLEKFIFKL